MAWVHYQKHMRGNEEIIISKSGNLSIPKKLRQKDNINIFSMKTKN